MQHWPNSCTFKYSKRKNSCMSIGISLREQSFMEPRWASVVSSSLAVCVHTRKEFHGGAHCSGIVDGTIDEPWFEGCFSNSSAVRSRVSMLGNSTVFLHAVVNGKTRRHPQYWNYNWEAAKPEGFLAWKWMMCRVSTKGGHCCRRGSFK